MAYHHVLTGQDIHTTIAFEYADAAARTAAAAAMVGAGTHIGKVVRQIDDSSLWMIKTVTPSVTWSLVGGDTTVSTTASNAYTIAVAGTTSANAADLTAREAYALAMLGTISPPLSALPDVTIPAPATNQVLTYDGSKWVAQDIVSGAVGFVTTYFLDDTPSTGTFSTLLTYPKGGSESVNSTTVQASDGEKFSESYISSSLNKAYIDAGIWEFNTYAYVDVAGFDSEVTIKILKRNAFGAETPLFSVDTGTINSLTPALYSALSFQGTFALDPIDFLVARYYAKTNSVSPRVVTFLHNGSENYSHFHTPSADTHNNLPGLQGGAAGEFYHITQAQNQALAGSAGIPSPTNVFVTSEDSRLATATLALTTAWTGTQAAADANANAASANMLAGEAYTLAAAGTAASVKKVGDTMTGNLAVPNVKVSSGTYPTSLASSGTMYYDFSGVAYQITTVDRNITISGTNMSPTSEIAVVLKSTGSGAYYITYSGSIAFFGSAPPSSITTKSVLIAFTSTGNTLSDVMGAAVTGV